MRTNKSALLAIARDASVLLVCGQSFPPALVNEINALQPEEKAQMDMYLQGYQDTNVHFMAESAIEEAMWQTRIDESPDGKSEPCPEGEFVPTWDTVKQVLFVIAIVVGAILLVRGCTGPIPAGEVMR